MKQRAQPSDWRTPRELGIGGPEDPTRRPGHLVKHADGRIGRTFTGQATMGGKVVVQWMEVVDATLPDGTKFKLPTKGIAGPRSLVRPDQITVIGHID